jgi:hypothetical protein
MMRTYDRALGKQIFAEYLRTAAKKMEDAGQVVRLSAVKDTAVLVLLRNSRRTFDEAFALGLMDFAGWIEVQARIDRLISKIERRNPRTAEEIEKRERIELLAFKKPRLP